MLTLGKQLHGVTVEASLPLYTNDKESQHTQWVHVSEGAESKVHIWCCGVFVVWFVRFVVWLFVFTCVSAGVIAKLKSASSTSRDIEICGSATGVFLIRHF